MGNHTVNQKEQKKEFIEGAAGADVSITTTAVAIQNNTPHKLHIEVTNGKEAKNLPFMIEAGEIVSDSNVEVTIKAENMTPEQNAKRNNARLANKLRRDEDITH